MPAPPPRRNAMRANPATVPVAAVWRGGGCPACVGEIALARWLGRRGAIAIVNRTDGQTTCAIDRGALPARFHARETDGPVRARGFDARELPASR